MSEHEKADQARKGLIDSVKGKAKEVVGAVTGNDSLTAEGQLDQTQAKERKEANSVEAIADAESEQALSEAVDAKVEGAQERNAVNAQKAAADQVVQGQQNAQKAEAERVGAQQAAAARTQAEIDAQRDVDEAKAKERADVRAAADEAVEAVEEHQTADRLATRAHEEADRIRARADRLTSDADLP